ncbi:MAG: hypothetical protein PHD19_03795 [Dechloromonas sp.]|nr:hypothetical protein [Dechloromonas sp.]
MTKPTDKVPGKSYTWGDLAQVQIDQERYRLGSSYASKERTKAMVEAINKRREGGK